MRLLFFVDEVLRSGRYYPKLQIRPKDSPKNTFHDAPHNTRDPFRDLFHSQKRGSRARPGMDRQPPWQSEGDSSDPKGSGCFDPSSPRSLLSLRPDVRRKVLQNLVRLSLSIVKRVIEMSTSTRVTPLPPKESHQTCGTVPGGISSLSHTPTTAEPPRPTPHGGFIFASLSLSPPHAAQKLTRQSARADHH